MQKRKILFIALAGLFLAGISIGLYQLIKQLGEYHSGEEAYLALEQFVALAEPAVSEDTVARQWPQIDFAQLQDINNNFAGWLYVAENFSHRLSLEFGSFKALNYAESVGAFVEQSP